MDLKVTNKKMEKKQKVVPCEVYSRVVGYYRPVKYWNDSKKQEFKDRKMFSVEKWVR